MIGFLQSQHLATPNPDMKGKKSVKLQTLPDDGSMDSSGEASQAEFQGELAKALVLPLVGGE